MYVAVLTCLVVACSFIVVLLTTSVSFTTVN